MQSAVGWQPFSRSARRPSLPAQLGMKGWAAAQSKSGCGRKRCRKHGPGKVWNGAIRSLFRSKFKAQKTPLSHGLTGFVLSKQERNRRRFAKRGWAAKAGRGPACGPVFERQPDAWPQPSPHTARQRRQPRKYHTAKMEKALAFGMSFSPFISNQGKEKCLQSVSDMENHAGRTHINPFSAPTYCETGVRGF